MGKRNKVTTRDIAEYTGVSQSTVSMILSEKKNVSFGEETVQKVKKAAKSLPGIRLHNTDCRDFPQCGEGRGVFPPFRRK